jgi:hypothetical protein
VQGYAVVIENMSVGEPHDESLKDRCFTFATVVETAYTSPEYSRQGEAVDQSAASPQRKQKSVTIAQFRLIARTGQFGVEYFEDQAHVASGSGGGRECRS